MKKLLCVVIALMMMVTFVFAEEAAPAEVKTLYAGVLTVGCEAGYPPFEMVADDGESVVGLHALVCWHCPSIFTVYLKDFTI